MHPAGSLYERPVNVDKAIEQHDDFRRVLESHGFIYSILNDCLSFFLKKK